MPLLILKLYIFAGAIKNSSFYNPRENTCFTRVFSRLHGLIISFSLVIVRDEFFNKRRFIWIQAN